VSNNINLNAETAFQVGHYLISAFKRNAKAKCIKQVKSHHVHLNKGGQTNDCKPDSATDENLTVI
jgi:hypothetical protein